ncbi:MAG: carboxylating nicotinate-nucleotide diphosphorylase [Bacteroidia bacterium]|nr:carboxylating nicotinate-nucleotide diphosphorylase [Bacteroidia bacterium]
MEILQHPDIKELIEIAIREDVGNGDHSSLACIPSEKVGKAYCIAKENGIIAGLELAAYIFKRIDSNLTFVPLKTDGDSIAKGDHVFEVFGSDISILTAERLVLNFMQRLSGIATQSKKMALLLKDYHTTILDTRKTTPGMRLLEKWAVQLGGCKNHRMGLYDMIMLKDNHIDFAGGVKQAIEKTHQYQKFKGLNLPIEIETRNLDEVKQVLEVGGVSRIMLDNFKPEQLKEAIELIGGKFETEASGGITMDNIEAYAASKVDFISVGALTHSSKSIDLSLRVSE